MKRPSNSDFDTMGGGDDIDSDVMGGDDEDVEADSDDDVDEA